MAEPHSGGLRAFSIGYGMPWAATCSGKKTSTATIKSGPCGLASVLLYTNGSNDASLVIYDNTEASGTIIREVYATAADGKGPFGNANIQLRCNYGIHAVLTGTGASYIIDYLEV